jgi:hypothetical protein
LSEPQRGSFDSAAPAIPYIAYAYDPAGLMVGKPLGYAGGNGVEYTAVFDAVNRQVTCTWEVGSQTLAGYNYAYDDASNRKYEEKIHDPSNSQLYQYDTLYQVKKFEAGQQSPHASQSSQNSPRSHFPGPTARNREKNRRNPVGVVCVMRTGRPRVAPDGATLG